MTNYSTSVCWMNEWLHARMRGFFEEMRWRVEGTFNAAWNWEEIQVERGALNSHILCQRQVIKLWGVTLKSVCFRGQNIAHRWIISSFEKMLIYIRISSVYPIIWLIPFWLSDDQLGVFKIECFSSSRIWSLRLLWQPPWKLRKALSEVSKLLRFSSCHIRVLAVALTERLTLNLNEVN